jgi:hypothetical protein
LAAVNQSAQLYDHLHRPERAAVAAAALAALAEVLLDHQCPQNCC